MISVITSTSRHAGLAVDRVTSGDFWLLSADSRLVGHGRKLLIVLPAGSRAMRIWFFNGADEGVDVSKSKWVSSCLYIFGARSLQYRIHCKMSWPFTWMHGSSH